MDKYHYEESMKKVVAEIENLLNNSIIGTASDKALLLDYKAAMTDQTSKAIKFEQQALELLTEINGKRQIIGVYKRSAAYDIVQLEHLDNQIVAKVPSYLRFLFLLRLRYRTLAHKQLLPGSMLIMQLDHCPLAFPRFGLFSGVSLDALALETAVHTMTDAAAVSSLHMSCRLLTRAPYQP